jgi:hypothetical protein
VRPSGLDLVISRRLTVLPVLRWATLLVICIASASASAAERASVTLTYAAKDAAAANCPDEATFRDLVAARLGYDPFAPSGSLTLAVELQRRGDKIVGRLNLTGKDNESRGERTLRSRADDCFELATSMALAAAVAVDPDAVRAQATAARAPATPTPAPEPPRQPPPMPRPDSGRAPAPAPAPDQFDTGVRLEAAFVLPVGIVPAPRGGVRAGAAAHLGLWSIGAEGAFLFPSSRASPYGEVSAYVVHASLVPCANAVAFAPALLSLCVVGSLGVMRSDAAEVTRAEPATDPFATVGPRAAVVVMVSRSFGLGAAADIPVTLSRVHLDIDDGGKRQEVWASNRLGFVGGVSAVVRLR